MKNILLTLIISIVTIQYSVSQETFDTGRNAEKNIYIHTLQRYFDTIEKNTLKNNKEYYIEKKYVYLDNYPNEINGFKINWVKEVNIKKILKSVKTDFITLMINPLKVIKDDFYVGLIPFYVHVKNNKYTVWNGVYEFQYAFDTQLNGLIYKRFTSE